MDDKVWIRKCALHGEYTTINCAPCYKTEINTKADVDKDYNIEALHDERLEQMQEIWDGETH